MNGQSDKIVLSMTQDHKTLIYFTESLCKRWQLQTGEKMKIIAGQRLTFVEVQSLASTEKECKLSVNAAQSLSLPNFTQSILITFFEATKTLVIGPFLAILINGTLLDDGTFGEMETFFQEMKTYCSERGYPFYVTTLQASNDGLIQGYWPTNEGWKLRHLPLANVFYNRIHSRQLEQTALFKQFTTELQQQQVHMFNAKFLSKFEVHHLLLKEQALHPYLPKSILFQHKEDFLSFIQSYPSIYIKPIFGSQGRHIGKATKISKGWVFEHSNPLYETKLIGSEIELFYFLKKFCKNRSYLIQQCIPLLEYDHKKMDFRILLHQAKDQVWKVTSMVARIGDSGHIVSNIARGADMKNATQFLKEKFDRTQALQLQQTLIQLAKKSAQSLAHQYQGLLAELGIDLALDNELHPWIIEINSKPSKKYEGHYHTFRPSVKAIVDCMNMLYLHHTSK